MYNKLSLQAHCLVSPITLIIYCFYSIAYILFRRWIYRSFSMPSIIFRQLQCYSLRAQYWLRTFSLHFRYFLSYFSSLILRSFLITFLEGYWGEARSLLVQTEVQMLHRWLDYLESYLWFNIMFLLQALFLWELYYQLFLLRLGTGEKCLCFDFDFDEECCKLCLLVEMCLFFFEVESCMFFYVLVVYLTFLVKVIGWVGLWLIFVQIFYLQLISLQAAYFYLRKGSLKVLITA